MYIVHSGDLSTIYINYVWTIDHKNGTLIIGDLNKFVNQSGDVVDVLNDKNNYTRKPYKISVNNGPPLKCDFFDVFEKYYTYRRHNRIHIADIKTGAVVKSLKSTYYGMQYKNYFIMTNRIINMDTLKMIEIKKQDKPHFSNGEQEEAEQEEAEQDEAEREEAEQDEAEQEEAEQEDDYSDVTLTVLPSKRKNSDSSDVSEQSEENEDDPATAATEYPNIVIGEKCLIYSEEILTPQMIDFVQDMSNGYQSTYFKPLLSENVYIMNGGDLIFRLEPENTKATKKIHPQVHFIGQDQVTITLLKYYEHVDNLPVLKIYEWALEELYLIENLLLSVDYIRVVTPGKFTLKLYTEKETHATVLLFALPDVKEHNGFGD